MHASGFIYIDGLVNFRDVGGLTVPGGVLRRRVLFRSESLHQVSDEGTDAIRALGIKTIIDLRTIKERAEYPGPLPSIHIPLQEAHEDDDIADSRRLSKRAEGEAKLRDVYMMLLERAQSQFRAIFNILADRNSLPAVVHCAAGKDRTGLAMALVLSAVGVPREVVLDDFVLQSSDPEWIRRREIIHLKFMSMGIDADAARGLISTPRWTMEQALEWLDSEYGGVTEYLRVACLVEQSTFIALGRNLIDRPF